MGAFTDHGETKLKKNVSKQQPKKKDNEENKYLYIWRSK